MTRKRFTEKQVLATLIHQGVEITCFRTKAPITLENVRFIEREHLHERELGGPDEPGNCRYSLKQAHSVITNGTKATSAGSSKHRIAKAKRIERNRLAEELAVLTNSTIPDGEKNKHWPSRKLKSRPFEKGHRPFRRRVA